MSWLSRVVNVVRRNRVNHDLDDEIQFHLDARTDELVRSGMAADEARREAQRLFGNRLNVRDTSGDIKLSARLESILLDVNFALRLWRRNKTVTAAALISLSLAVGACAAAFSLVDALILRSLPVSDPASLIYVAQRAPGDREDGLSFNYPLFNSMRDATRAQVRLFAMSDQRRGPATFDGSGEPDRVYGQWVSGDALDILGVKPAIGRLLTPSDDVHPGQHPVAVLSHEFWRRRFASDPQVIGRWVTIRDKSLQIVGVAEAGFTGVEPGIMTDLWAPTMMWDDAAISDASTRWFRIWGRMQPDTAPRRQPRRCNSSSRTSRASWPTSRSRISSGSSTRVCTCDRRPTGRHRCAVTSRAHCGCSPAWPCWCSSSPAPMSLPFSSRAPLRASARWRCGCRSAPAVAASCSKY